VFSQRLSSLFRGEENALSVLERQMRESGSLIDLTESNPTRVGLPYPARELALALADPEVAQYQPSPRGLPSARAAIAADYQRRDLTIDPDRLLLTASSSESYAFLFKLLCDPGDALLVPEPSYPLFEYLARLEGVCPIPYRLAYDGAWRLDQDSIAEALTAADGRARALVLVNPNNPTGSFLQRGELAPLVKICAQHRLAAICDEVFADYPFTAPAPGRAVRCLAIEPEAVSQVLTFSLGGLSKSCGLPQLKLGWIAVGGPADTVAAALPRLELIADTYLSPSTPVQLALPRLLVLGASIRSAIGERVRANRSHLERAVGADSSARVLPAEGGWSAILQVPRFPHQGLASDEAWALRLLREDRVVVSPGYFFDMPEGAFLVVSLLVEPDALTEGVGRILARCR
jgi:aspartate/methionine/tyrosine aminotransferase